MKNKKQDVTVAKIRNSLYDADLDTEYREALAYSILVLGYLRDSTLKLTFGTENQRIENFDTIPLNSNQISEIIHLMMYEMRNDFQYGTFKPIAREYLSIAEQMKKEELQNKKENNKIKDKKRPICNISDTYGNMFKMLGEVSYKLKENNMYDESREMIERATLSYDYDEAFKIIEEYVEPVEIVKGIQEEEEFG